MIKQQAIRWWLGSIGAILAGIGCDANADPFRNLDFQSAVPQPVAGTSLVPIDTAMPGWHGFFGDIEQTKILFHASYAGSAGIELRDTGTLPAGTTDFSALFYSGVFLSAPGKMASASLSQVGEIPAGSQSMTCETSTIGNDVDPYLLVSINGQVVPSIYVSHNLVAVDVSNYSGQEVNLSFTASIPASPSFPQSLFQLDNIQFSSTSIPEPSAVELLFFGGALLVLGVKSRRL